MTVALRGPACEASCENVLKVDKSVLRLLLLLLFFFNQLVKERLEGWLNGGSFLTFYSGCTSVCILRRRIITFHGV